MSTFVGIDLGLGEKKTAICFLGDDFPRVAPTFHAFSYSLKKTASFAEEVERLDKVRRALVAAIRTWGHCGIRDIFIESAVKAPGRSTDAWYLHGALYVSLRTLHEQSPRLFPLPALVAPTTLKKFVTDSGAGDKSEMRLAVFKRWNLELGTEDEIDAFGLAAMAAAWGDVTFGRKLTKAQTETLKKVRR